METVVQAATLDARVQLAELEAQLRRYMERTDLTADQRRNATVALVAWKPERSIETCVEAAMRRPPCTPQALAREIVHDARIRVLWCVQADYERRTYTQRGRNDGRIRTQGRR